MVPNETQSPLPDAAGVSGSSTKGLSFSSEIFLFFFSH